MLFFLAVYAAVVDGLLHVLELGSLLTAWRVRISIPFKDSVPSATSLKKFL